ncbi:MAG: hypothetical protein B5M48_03185 [Candidatus Omnitrophica bacterium 4484_213]|nr:MAG: hypothetical protein B5M48_03185 [Candidatus Omnitrophica bacterium 4484_213]
MQHKWSVISLKKQSAYFQKKIRTVSVYDRIIKESNTEEEFAKTLDKDSRIKLFIKLPNEYKIETPAGNYTPD